ncbi:MAG TPA: hypothetical protein VFJ14_06430, partial [Nocardioidaceae bacterium]|nr:hypothetical protein [Nocardioidaceae bacterium]
MFDRPVDELTVEELDVEETLDAIEAWHAERLERETREFCAAAHYADLHHPETLARRAHGRVLPGTERPRQLGGAGTPAVAEFAAAELGARIGTSPYGARMLIAD